MLLSTPSVPAIWGTIISFLAVSIIVVILRFYTRRRLKLQLQLDDWLMLPATVMVVACCSILFYGVQSKTMGYPAMEAAIYHYPELANMEMKVKRSDQYAAYWAILTSRKLEHSFFCILIPALGLIKLSVLFLYRRIFVVQKSFLDPRNLVISAMIVIVVLWILSFTFATIFSCGLHFTDVYYDFDLSNRVCVDTLNLGYWFAITDFVTDALVILIPVPLVWRLHLPIGQRLAVMCVFLVGIMSTVASILRLASQVWVHKVGIDPSMDEELILTQELFWGAFEATVALIASCLPTLRALLKIPAIDSVIRSFRGILSLRSTSSPDASFPEFSASEKSGGFIVTSDTVTLKQMKTGESQEV